VRRKQKDMGAGAVVVMDKLYHYGDGKIGNVQDYESSGARRDGEKISSAHTRQATFPAKGICLVPGSMHGVNTMAPTPYPSPLPMMITGVPRSADTTSIMHSILLPQLVFYYLRIMRCKPPRRLTVQS
jgi:hypothetical protein